MDVIRPGPSFQKDFVIFFEGGQSSQPRPHDHTDLFGVLRCDVQLGIFQGLLGGGDGILNEEIHFLDLFLINV